VTPAGLAHAGEAACQATALCQQVVGAIGYTLEFPLQRAFRRARAVRIWGDAVLARMDAGARA
jgi:butyryl-CoA dehydrogenase